MLFLKHFSTDSSSASEFKTGHHLKRFSDQKKKKKNHKGSKTNNNNNKTPKQKGSTSMRPVSGWKLRAGSSVVMRHWMAQPLSWILSCVRSSSFSVLPSAILIWACTRSTLHRINTSHEDDVENTNTEFTVYIIIITHEDGLKLQVYFAHGGAGIAWWDSLLVSWLKGCKFESQQQWQENFLLQTYVCWLLLGVHSTPMLSQRHVRDSCQPAKSVGGTLQLNTHTPLTQRNHSGLAMLLSWHSVGTYQEISSQVTHQGTLSHSCLSLLSHWGLTLA